jgi:hypothetical protein
MRFHLPALMIVTAGIAAVARGAPPVSLVLESTIVLGEVRGRIDHLAIDAGRRRLYVAELGNNSLGVVDLKHGKLLRTMEGFSEPQGAAYVPSADMVYVSNAGDGSVRVLRGADLTAVDRIDLGTDADNIRFDGPSNRVYVGYGSGALAIIDAATHRKIGDIPLKAHPESFQIDASSQHVYVNVPGAGEIAVLAADQKRQVMSWQSRVPAANYPMALDELSRQALVVYRHPSKLAVMDLEDGRVRSMLDTCGDADDVAFDGRRQRVYVSCGEGFVDIFAKRNATYERAGRVATAIGARTALFDPVADRLYVAARATSAAPAAILVLRPD